MAYIAAGACAAVLEFRGVIAHSIETHSGARGPSACPRCEFQVERTLCAVDGLSRGMHEVCDVLNSEPGPTLAASSTEAQTDMQQYRRCLHGLCTTSTHHWRIPMVTVGYSSSVLTAAKMLRLLVRSITSSKHGSSNKAVTVLCGGHCQISVVATRTLFRANNVAPSSECRSPLGHAEHCGKQDTQDLS